MVGSRAAMSATNFALAFALPRRSMIGASLLVAKH